MTEPTGRTFDRSIVEGPIGRAVWMLAWPTMLQNVIGGMQGLVDHAMVGHFVGYAGNAAIGVSWQIYLVVQVFIGSLFTGMGVLVARFAGRNEAETVNRVVYQAFLTAGILCVGILAPLGYFLAPSLLNLVNAAPAVQAEALPYIRTMFIFNFGMMVFFMLGGALRSAGDARTPLRLGIAMTVLNVAISVILIRGLGPIPAFGTTGAAMGTVISAGIITIAAAWFLLTGRWVVHIHRGLDWRPDPAVIRQLFRFGLPTGIQGVAMNIGGVILLRFIGSLANSAEAQAAYSVGYTQLFSLVTWTSVGIMGATAAFAGQNLGAGRPERSVKGTRVASGIGVAVAVGVGILFLSVPDLLLGAFGMEDPAVAVLGAELLAFLSVSGVFVAVALAHNGALQGTGDTRGAMYISLISQLALPLAVCWFLQETVGLEAWHIWLAILLGHMTRCVLGIVRFRQGHWRGIEVGIG